MPIDAGIYGLQQPVKINSPFAGLAEMMAQREQQRATAESRRALAQQTDEKTKILQQQQADTASVDAALGQGGTPEEMLARVPGHLRSLIAKQFQESDEWNRKAQEAKRAAEKAEIEYAAHGAESIKAWEPHGGLPAMVNAAKTFLEKAKKDGHDVSELAQAIEQDPSSLPARLDAVIAMARGPQAPMAPHVVGGALVDNSGKELYKAPEKPEKVTYGAPQTQMVGGKRSLVRAGSDGRMYDMNLKPIEAAAIAPEPQSGTKPTYEWAQTPEGTRLLTPDEIRKQGATKPIVATDKGKYKNAEPVLTAIAELSEKINTGQGLMAKMAGGASKVAAKANYDDDVAEFQSLVEGFTPLMARALGHTGVLTQQDVDSVKALFPRPGESKSLRDRKIARVRDIFNKLEGADADGAVKPAAPPKGETPEQRIKRLVGGG